jgi:hypothetical protein
VNHFPVILETCTHFSHACQRLHIFHLSRPHDPNNSSIYCKQYNYEASCYTIFSIILRSIIFLSTLLSYMFSLFYSLNVRDQSFTPMHNRKNNSGKMLLFHCSFAEVSVLLRCTMLLGWCSQHFKLCVFVLEVGILNQTAVCIPCIQSFIFSYTVLIY